MKPRKPKIHVLKVWPEFLDDLISERKTFELRRYDRDFRAGDYLMLREWSPVSEKYGDRQEAYRVTHILAGEEFGLRPGYCVMSINARLWRVHRISFKVARNGRPIVKFFLIDGEVITN